jgi:hypothetical protein
MQLNQFKLIFVILMLAFNISHAQSYLLEKDKNAYIFEAFGHSRSLISVNYERFLRPTNESYFFYSLRTGIGYIPGVTIKSKRLGSIITVPFVFSILTGKKDHHVQLGLSYTPMFGHDFIDSTTTSPTIYRKFESAFILSLGYRYMNSSGLIFQIFPILDYTKNSKFNIFFGMSIGGSF